MCSGSLISSDMVVTAGHCCDGQSADMLGVRVGNYHIYEEDPDQADIPVKTVILHEEYDSWTIENDICLLELSSEADITSPAIDTINLPSEGEEYQPGTECTVSGWGHMEGGGGGTPTVLQKITLPVVSYEDCIAGYGGDLIYDSMLCVGGVGGKDACQGDSGGPLSCGAELSGLISWGYGCGDPQYPGVYTQISHFITWINNNMQ